MAKERTDYFDDDLEDDIIDENGEGNDNRTIDFTDNDNTSQDKKEDSLEDKEDRDLERDTIIRGYNRLRLTLYSIVALIVISLITWLWLRYFSPYTTEAVESGRIMEMKCQGRLFKTYEGILLSEKYVDYPDKWLEYDFPFSVESDSIARQIMRLKGSGKRVNLIYQEYQGTVFWRGNSHRIITAVEVIDKDK